MRLGIISALHQEQTGLIDLIDAPLVINRGMRNYTSGTLWGVECVCVLSRIGKVAAAATAAILIERFGVTHILFTGVAGSAASCVAVGDIVIADELVQHDMDSSPLYPRFEIPLSGISHVPSDLVMTQRIHHAASAWLATEYGTTIQSEEREIFRLHNPKIHRGLIGSGDEFVDSRQRLANLKEALPTLLAVEMEGAAVAQVCFECTIPFAVIRVISDGANEHAHGDFLHFIERVAAHYTFHIVKYFCDAESNHSPA